jgi:dissimilatory sulfite reductase (desulfoviridin) alpha/beta subunit
MGTRLRGVYSFEEIPAVIEKVMLWYKENGYAKERLGAVIDRLGIDSLERALAGDDLLNRKQEILSAPIRER